MRLALFGVAALNNGNYVVSSPFWSNGTIQNVGAVTWGNGATGIIGSVSQANSLVGSNVSDRVGIGGVTTLTNGNYVISSTAWSNGSKPNTGAITYGLGIVGTSGLITSDNSVIGTASFGGSGLNFGYDSVNQQLVVGRPADNIVTLFRVSVINPVPAISRLSPNATAAGSGAFALTVRGANFLNSSSVLWNNSARPTTFVNSTQLTANITMTDVATASTSTVTVFNPALGGGTSSAQTFTTVAIACSNSNNANPGGTGSALCAPPSGATPGIAAILSHSVGASSPATLKTAIYAGQSDRARHNRHRCRICRPESDRPKRKRFIERKVLLSIRYRRTGGNELAPLLL